MKKFTVLWAVFCAVSLFYGCARVTTLREDTKGVADRFMHDLKVKNEQVQKSDTIIPESGASIPGDQTSKSGYCIVNLSGIPVMTEQNKEQFNGQILCCVHDDQDRNIVGLYHSYKYENGFIPSWGVIAGASGCIKFSGLSALHGNEGRFLIGWFGNIAGAQNLETGDLQITYLDNQCGMDSICFDLHQWGTGSPASVNMESWVPIDTGNPIPCVTKVLIYGEYHAMCDVTGGPARSLNDLRYALREFKKRWPGVIGTRNWIIDGRSGNPHPWVMVNGKYDLSKFNVEYLERVKNWADIHREEGCISFFDYFDNYYMCGDRWINHPLNPANNLQATYGVQFDDDAFPAWFQMDQNPDFREFQKRYVQAVATLLKDNRYIIHCSGNEMVSGPEEDRIKWHTQIAAWIKEVDPGALFTCNDLDYTTALFSNSCIDLLSIHGCGGIRCLDGSSWEGQPDHAYYKQFNKIYFLDNDGLWQCRDSIQNVVQWYNLVKSDYHLVVVYGAKGPYPNDTDASCNWNNYGIPLLEALGAAY